MLTEEKKRLLEERGTCVSEMRSILDKADKESKGVLSAEQQEKYNALEKRQDEIKDRLDREERLHSSEREIASPARERSGNSDENRASEADQMHVRAFNSFLVGGRERIGIEELRHLQATNLLEGGSLVAPVEWVSQLIKKLDNRLFIRSRATRFTLSRAATMGFPTLENDPDDGDWTGELAMGNPDTTMTTGKREFKPNPLAKSIKLSNTLLERSGVPVETLVQDRLSFKFGVAEEKGFMTGSGAGRPLGLFTASSQGISTGRDVVGGTSSAPTMDKLIDVQESVKDQYQPGCEWVIHRDVLKLVRQLKDNNNQYLWQPSAQSGQPDQLLGKPVNRSEYAPNTISTGAYFAIYGDLSYYWIVDALDMRMQRLVELYALTNQTAFIARKETDGMPILEEAFARAKFA